jgi:hypothetical protein
MLRIIKSLETNKLHCLQDASVINGGHVNSVKHEVIIHFKNKKKEYLKGKLMSLQQTYEEEYQGLV